MTAPRLEIDLDKIYHNACELVGALAKRGVMVTGVTKATLGSPEIANTLHRAGVRGLGDSRIENIEKMRRAGVSASMALIRSPMSSQVDRVVRWADVSFNSELDVISKLSIAAQEAKRHHGIVLMVELGDLREGIMPGDLSATVRETVRFPNITFIGIGTNLACRSGVSPDADKMAELSGLADSIDSTFGPIVRAVSGGNSANLAWALSEATTGRVNNLRLGESILLGRETLHRRPIEHLHGDAITLVAEVIESKVKPSQPWGELAESAFGEPSAVCAAGPISQTILAIGRQDIDPEGLTPPPGSRILAASSDHLIVDSGDASFPVGSEMHFEVNYSALLRAMTSGSVTKVMKATKPSSHKQPASSCLEPPAGEMRPRSQPHDL